MRISRIRTAPAFPGGIVSSIEDVNDDHMLNLDKIWKTYNRTVQKFPLIQKQWIPRTPKAKLAKATSNWKVLPAAIQCRP